MTYKNYYVIEYHGLEKLAEQVLGLKGWGFVEDLELMNDVAWDTEIDENEDFKESFDRVLAYKRANGVSPCTIARDVLVLLNLFGHIPAGNILVRVSW